MRINIGWIAVVCAISTIPAVAGETTLYSFGPYDKIGSNPNGTLLRDASGALYGTTMLGGAYYNGTILKLSPPGAGQTQWTLSVLYTFTGGSDGGTPNPGLVMDASGALYGTASSGGSWLNQGLVFKLTPPARGSTQWTETVLHYFYHSYAYGADDGANPSGGLIMDRNGALYGTTDLGGNISSLSSYGTVFKLTPLDAGRTKWAETILYRFGGGADGANPMSGVMLDAAGSLYGTTLYGGSGGCLDMLSNYLGCGTVFKLTPPGYGQTAWTKSTLHSFSIADGSIPNGRLLLDYYGGVYGTTFQGGSGQCHDSLYNVIGCGIVYKLTPPTGMQRNWTESVLHDFAGPDGAFPQGGLIADTTGALYGTTSGGGPITYGVLGSYGLVYKLTPGQRGWTETVLHNFDISTSGDTPVGELVRDPYGRFFGVAHLGGAHGNGTVFEITP
jgi:hypothetical protein